jgi:hypothetical protein
MYLADGVTALIADAPAAFAKKVITLSLSG